MTTIAIIALVNLILLTITLGALLDAPGKELRFTYGERWFYWLLNAALWTWVLYLAGGLG